MLLRPSDRRGGWTPLVSSLAVSVNSKGARACTRTVFAFDYQFYVTLSFDIIRVQLPKTFVRNCRIPITGAALNALCFYRYLTSSVVVALRGRVVCCATAIISLSYYTYVPYTTIRLLYRWPRAINTYKYHAEFYLNKYLILTRITHIYVMIILL